MKTPILALMLIVSMTAFSQTVNSFKLTNVQTGETISPGNFPSCEGLVIIFTSNECPYDEYYRKRIADMAATYGQRVPVLLVNSNPDPAESNENMAKKAKSIGLKLPYLADKEQSLMTTLNARKSPEAFLLKNNKGSFTVVYRGAIDDNAQVEADVRQNYLKNAIEKMLSNQKIDSQEVRPVGCTLKKKA